MEYSFRKSALENEKSYVLKDGKLVITDLKTSSTRHVDLANIQSVELKYIAKRSMPDAYLCQVKDKSGKNISLSSQHYAGVASFENRAASYTPFIKALHQDLSKYPIKFTKGINSFRYWFSMIFFIGAGFIALIIALAALIPYGIFIIAVLVFLFFRLKKHFQKNKSGQYDPNHIPAELLP